MESYEIVEGFEKLWSKMPKSTPLKAEAGGIVNYVLLLPAGDLRVYAELNVGVKGGIKEAVYVFDPSQTTLADRLIVSCFDGDDLGSGALFPLRELRGKAQKVAVKERKEFVLGLCEEALWSLLEEIKRSPLNPKSLRLISSTSQSLRRVIQGGIPTQGRRGGGAPGH